MKKKIIFLLIFAFSLSVFAQVKMEGFYELDFGKSYENSDFKYNFWDPNYYFETKLFANPVNNSSLFLKFYSDKDNNNYYNVSHHQEAVVTEANMTFMQQKNGYGFKTVLFSRGSSFYWTDSSLLGILNTGSVNNDNNGQGGRLDVWYPFGGSFTYVFSDFSSGEGDDIHLFRIRQSLFKNKLNTGIFYQRKNYNESNPALQKDAFNDVLANDYKLRLGRYFINWEIAASRVPSEKNLTDLTKKYYQNGLKDFYKGNLASKIEINGFRIGLPTLGYWSFTPGAYTYGNTFRNYMGNNQNNNYGYWINSYYLLPQRAITLTLNYSQNQKIIPDTLFTNGIARKIYDKNTNLYSEIYIEFINGFKSKLYFNKRDEHWQGSLYKHYDFFVELSVENKLAKLLTQFKIKDMGQAEEKQIGGIELSANIMPKIRLFTRGMIANDKAGSRHSIFAEIQYRITGNTELYLQYGPSWWGAYGLVNDDGFASSGKMTKDIKLILKGWF